MSIVKAVRLFYPKSLLFSVPNGGYRMKTTALILKATGLMPGVSDLIFIHRSKIIFVEVKTEKGVQTQNQIEFEQKIKEFGFGYWVVRSANEMLDRIKEYEYKGW